MLTALNPWAATCSYLDTRDEADTGDIETFIIIGHTKEIYALAFSPDGKHLASGSRDKTVRVYNASNGELPAIRLELSVGSRRRGPHLAITPPGCCVFSLCSPGEELQKMTEHTDHVKGLAFTPEGELISGSLDNTMRTYGGVV